MGANLRVEVAKDDLLTLVRTRRAEYVAKHDAAVKAYAPRKAKWQKAVVAALTRALAAAKKGEVPGGDSWRRSTSITLHVDGEQPDEPELDTTHVDRDIKVLELSAKPTIIITANDHFARYL